MAHKIKLGTTPFHIVSIVFGCLGIIYLCVGIGLLQTPAGTEDFQGGIVFAALGGGFLTAAIILFAYTYFHRRHLQEIVDSGKYIWGEIVDIAPNYKVQINNRNPFQLLIRYQDRFGNIHIFRSRNLKTYPDRSVIGKQVKVYYENETYKHYYADVEDVLPKVIEH